MEHYIPYAYAYVYNQLLGKMSNPYTHTSFAPWCYCKGTTIAADRELNNRGPLVLNKLLEKICYLIIFDTINSVFKSLTLFIV